MAKVKVTVTVNVDGVTKTAESSGEMTGDPLRLAEGLMDSTTGEVRAWVRQRTREGH